VVTALLLGPLAGAALTSSGSSPIYDFAEFVVSDDEPVPFLDDSSREVSSADDNDSIPEQPFVNVEFQLSILNGELATW
jgi:hypothetical protein